MAEDSSVITTEGNPVLQFVRGKFWVNNHTHILQGKHPISTEYLYFALSNVKIQGYITGAAQPKISQANMNRIAILKASGDLLNTFNEIVVKIYDQVDLLYQKNKNLRKTRDLLLPKLLSGKIDVSDLDIDIGEDAA
jgi:type I restriction enzyme S subunit